MPQKYNYYIGSVSKYQKSYIETTELILFRINQNINVFDRENV